MGDRFVSDGVGTSRADGDGVIHGGAEDEDSVARELDVDGAGAKGGGGIGNDCCDVGDRCVSDGVGTSKADGDGVVHGGTENVDGVAREIDVDGVDARGGGGIGND